MTSVIAGLSAPVPGTHGVRGPERLNAIVADEARRLTVGIPPVTMDPAGIQVPAFWLHDVKIPPSTSGGSAVGQMSR
jgi:hypothetical protein